MCLPYSMRLSWSFEEVNEKLQGIMAAIHKQCKDAMKEYELKNAYKQNNVVTVKFYKSRASDDYSYVMGENKNDVIKFSSLKTNGR